MPVRSTIHGSEDTLFITFTCFKWLPLIRLTNGYDLVYKWFDFLKSQEHLVTGYPDSYRDDAQPCTCPHLFFKNK